MARLTTIKPLVATLPGMVAKHSDVRDHTVEWRGWYKLKRWRDLRAATLEAAQFTCIRCGWCDVAMRDLHAMLAPLGVWDRKMLKAPLLVADHTIPHRGDHALFWYAENLSCLCKTCHDSDKQREERRSHG